MNRIIIILLWVNIAVTAWVVYEMRHIEINNKIENIYEDNTEDKD